MANTSRRRLQIVDQPRGRAPAAETPRQRLQRIGPDRVAKAVKSLRHLQQLSNPNVYDVRPGDREKIVKVLTEEVEQLAFVLAHPGRSVPVVQFDDEDTG